MRIYPKGQRVALVAVGVGFLLISSASMMRGSVAARIFYGAILVASLWWCYRGARLGLTVDQQGISERSLGRTRRVAWQEVKELTVTRGSGNAGAKFSMLVLHFTDGRELPLRAAARFSDQEVREIRDRVAVYRPAKGN